MKINPEQNKEIILQVAELMCIAARTAPKARGVDNITTAIVEGKDKDNLVPLMEKIGQEKNLPHFARDAKNLEVAPVAVIIGTKIEPIGLNYCGFCGAEQTCEDLIKKKGICTYNPLDLGIAIGSAVSVANSHHVDNRIMHSIGYAAIKAGLLPKEVQIAFGIPLSVTGKNPFFDRK
jgi:uncharacterized ferredoxin-like protein